MNYQSGTMKENRLYLRGGKRLFDLIITVPTLILLAPLFVLFGLLVYFRLGPPVLFRQQRSGLRGQPFTLFKFRTLSDSRDAEGSLLPDGERLNAFGRFLRSTSLDELPELINVLKGNMSLVGPRPLLVEYLDYYSREQARRHEVRPGITGWAQIHGRNAVSWEQKFEHDVWYVDRRSFWLDLRIILITLVKVVKCEGISSKNHPTTEKFRGLGQT